MGRKLALIIVLVAVSLAALTTGYLMQKDEAQAINVFAKASEYSSGSTVFDKMWSFNRAEADKWIKKSDMPTPRGAHSASEVNGKIYIIGGNAGRGISLSTVEEYDPATDTWKKRADMPTKRWALSTATVNGKIYAIGGNDARNVSLETVEEYDPATDRWTNRANLPIATDGHISCAVNGKIYVIGGGNPAGALSAVQEYKPLTNQWTEKTKMPTARFDLTASAVNGKIYAIGGSRVQGRPDLLDTSVVEEYDPTTDTWRKKAKMPAARERLAASEVNGKIYVIGGSALFFAPISTVEEYDPATDTWTKKSDMPTARMFLSTSAVNGKIYAIGGFTQAAVLATVEEYDTGFVPPQKVEAKGKLPISWGKIKAKY